MVEAPSLQLIIASGYNRQQTDMEELSKSCPRLSHHRQNGTKQDSMVHKMTHINIKSHCRHSLAQKRPYTSVNKLKLKQDTNTRSKTKSNSKKKQMQETTKYKEIIQIHSLRSHLVK